MKRIYTFVKYIISSFLSFLIDIGIFTILSKLFNIFIGDIAIIIGTVIARVISSLFNYFVNKNKVFMHNSNSVIERETLIKYYMLVIVQMFISAFLVWIIHQVINTDATFIKVIVDICIFVVNYFIQKKFIFKNKTY